jgi:hypothetical protein
MSSYGGDVANGQQTLEKLLTLNPRFAPAANNLAWLYREHGGDKEKALEVAQRTKEAVHDDLHISDTPGGSAISKASTSERLAY